MKNYIQTGLNNAETPLLNDPNIGQHFSSMLLNTHSKRKMIDENMKRRHQSVMRAVQVNPGVTWTICTQMMISMCFYEFFTNNGFNLE